MASSSMSGSVPSQLFLIAGGQLNRGHHRLAHSLGKAALGGLHNGLGGDGGARHAVDLSRTGCQQPAPSAGRRQQRRIRAVSPEVSTTTVGDGGLAEGHGDL